MSSDDDRCLYRWMIVVAVFVVSTAAHAGVTVGGTLELYDSVNLRGTTENTLRAFDIHDRSISLEDAVLDTTWTQGATSGRLALQLGDAPELYAGREQRWRYLQEAFATYTLPGKLAVSAGVFLSPVGPESVSVRDNFNWSRSNLFVALPFYHLGVRVAQPVGAWTFSALVSNGWNDIVDTNDVPSIAAYATYARDDWKAQVLYFGGAELTGAPSRHLLDAYVQAPIMPGVLAMLHVDGGGEGDERWAGAAGYLRVTLAPPLSIAARIDGLREWDGALLLPVAWVASETATFAWRVDPHAELRLEIRHDRAATAVYSDHRAQDTITLGAIGWFGS